LPPAADRLLPADDFCQRPPPDGFAIFALLSLRRFSSSIAASRRYDRAMTEATDTDDYAATMMSHWVDSQRRAAGHCIVVIYADIARLLLYFVITPRRHSWLSGLRRHCLLYLFNIISLRCHAYDIFSRLSQAIFSHSFRRDGYDTPQY